MKTLLDDLAAAMNDDNLHDVELFGSDGLSIRANKTVRLLFTVFPFSLFLSLYL
jgi:hypothetical protein